MKPIKLSTLLFSLFFLLCNFQVKAQKEKLQTAFIFQITRMIEWCPEGKEGNFIVAVAGNAPKLVQELSALNGRRLGGQIMEIKQFNTIDEIEKSNIIFVPDSEYSNIAQIEKKTEGTCALVITEVPGGANRNAGISIAYNSMESKLELEINRRYMRQKSFVVNNHLYNLASKTY